MSQIQSFIQSMGPAGPILTLTGDTGGAVGPDGGGNINILGEDNATSSGFAVIEGSPGTSTLSILPLQDTVSTNDAVATAFAGTAFTVSPNTAVVMSAHVIGNRSDYSAACGGFTIGIARRAAGGAILVSNSFTTLQTEDSPVGNPEFGLQVTGNDIEVFVRGTAGLVWNWTCTFTYQVQLL